MAPLNFLPLCALLFAAACTPTKGLNLPSIWTGRQDQEPGVRLFAAGPRQGCKATADLPLEDLHLSAEELDTLDYICIPRSDAKSSLVQSQRQLSEAQQGNSTSRGLPTGVSCTATQW